MHTSTAIALTVLQTYGFDPEAIYCTVTGKLIGDINPREFHAICESLTGTLEEAADDLAMRSIASMRPSMRWNLMREETLEQMRQSAPIETFAYLLNQLLDDPKDSMTGWFTRRLNRVKLFSRLDQEFITPESLEDFKHLMLWLLEVEAKLSLKAEISPFSAKALLESTDFVGFLTAQLKPWYTKRVEYHRKAELEAKYFANNPGARKAYANQWLIVKPKSDETIKREVKQAESNFMNSFLQELMQTVPETRTSAQRISPDLVESLTEQKPFARPSTKMPAWGKK